MIPRMLAAFMAAVVGLGCEGEDRGRESFVTTEAAGADAGPRKVALLVGINQYEDSNIRALRGALNDVEVFKDVLVGKFGFEEKSILTLRNEEATGDAIRKAFRRHLIDGVATKQDVVVFYYSGHGSQVLDDPEGDESDGLDETLVPYDSADSGKTDITDDEINALIRELSGRTENVTFVFDSCNSGTATRSAGLARRVERGLRPRPRATSRGIEAKESGMKDESVRYTLIAGALAEELSSEHTADNGVTYGALTYFLAQALNRAPEGATYRDVMDVVREDVSSLYKNQHPQLEGTEANRVIFGDTLVSQVKYVLVSAGASPREIRFDAGQVHGVTKGSVFEIYPPGSRTFDLPETPLGKATIDTVQPRASTAFLDEERDIPRGSRAVERERSFGCRQLWVHYLNRDRSELLRTVSDELSKYSFIHTAGPGEPYHLLLEHTEGKILMEAADSGVVSKIDAASPDAGAKVADEVKKWAKWYNVLSIRNPSPSPRVRIKFTVEAETPEGRTRSPFSFVGSPDAELVEGERIVATVESLATTDLYWHLLDLETDGTVSLVPPVEGDKRRLRKGGRVTFKLKTTIPEGRNSVTDVLKIFATVSDVDLGFLEQEPIVRGERRAIGGSGDPVAGFLACAALGGEPSPSPVPLDRWTTEERVIHVKRRR
jgi:hypothetical protein